MKKLLLFLVLCSSQRVLASHQSYSETTEPGLKCKTASKVKASESVANSKSERKSCGKPDALEELKKVALECQKIGFSGVDESFISQYATAFAESNPTPTPEKYKKTIENYQKQIVDIEKIIANSEEALSKKDDPDFNQKKIAYNAKIADFNAEIKSIKTKYYSAKEDEKAELKNQHENVYEEMKKYTEASNGMQFQEVTSLESILESNKKYLISNQKKLQEYSSKLNDLEKSFENPEAKKTANKSETEKFVLKQIMDTLRSVKTSSNFNDCGLTDAELFAIRMYTGSTYDAINSALRNKDVEKIKSLQHLISAINSGLTKISGYDGLVRRGSNLSPETLAKYYEGCVVTVDAFTSASTQDAFPAEYRFVIKSKTGAYIAPISNSPSEREVLFKAGTKFKILSKKDKEFTLQEVTK